MSKIVIVAFTLIAAGYGTGCLSREFALSRSSGAADIREQHPQREIMDLDAVKRILQKDPKGIAAADESGRSLLHLAARDGAADAVKFLLTRGIRADAKDVHGNTPLHLAAAYCRSDVAKVLLDNEASLQSRNDGRTTPLHNARCPDMVHLLINAGADVQVRDQAENTPLHLQNTKAAALALIEGGAPVNALNGHQRTPLHEAARHGMHGVAELLIARGANVHAKDADGATALHDASRSGRGPVAALLLKAGADIDVRDDRYGMTPLLMAVDEQHREVAKLLLDQGAAPNVRDKENRSALLLADDAQLRNILVAAGARVLSIGDAVVLGDLKRTEEFLKGDAALVNQTVDERATPLHLAAMEGHVAIARALVEHGANVHARDAGGFTPLHLAEGEAVARLLIDHGADVSARSVIKYTPLHAAVSSDRTAAAQTLLKSGARLEARDQFGHSPLHLVRSGPMAKLLLAAGADPNARDKDGNTPLMSVLQVPGIDEDAVKVLALHQESLAAKNKHGETAADLAREANRPEFLDTLRSRP